jgi:hypothetical protein
MQAADVTAAASSRLAFHLRLYHRADPQDNQKRRNIDAKVMPRRPALTMSARVDRFAISFVYFVFFLLP